MRSKKAVTSIDLKRFAGKSEQEILKALELDAEADECVKNIENRLSLLEFYQRVDGLSCKPENGWTHYAAMSFYASRAETEGRLEVAERWYQALSRESLNTEELRAFYIRQGMYEQYRKARFTNHDDLKALGENALNLGKTHDAHLAFVETRMYGKLRSHILPLAIKLGHIEEAIAIAKSISLPLTQSQLQRLGEGAINQADSYQSFLEACNFLFENKLTKLYQRCLDRAVVKLRRGEVLQIAIRLGVDLSVANRKQLLMKALLADNYGDAIQLAKELADAKQIRMERHHQVLGLARKHYLDDWDFKAAERYGVTYGKPLTIDELSIHLKLPKMVTPDNLAYARTLLAKRIHEAANPKPKGKKKVA